MAKLLGLTMKMISPFLRLILGVLDVLEVLSAKMPFLMMLT